MNPFDDQDGEFLVLVNAAGQLSLWPTFAAVPSGWEVVKSAGSHGAALDFVERSWPDVLQPAQVTPLNQ